jgi:2-polyprenyl-6-methoxyphenol hydroxylase-like FAD-dependent oxidoreductase
MRETADGVIATVETPNGQKEISANYLAGCDGGRSTVRKLLELTYDGFTLPQWLVACNVRYPFQDHGFVRAQFIVHPEHFCLIGKIDPSGLWRVSYNEKEDLTREEVLANVHQKFQALFPGPRPLKEDAYEIEMISPYRIHQRSAPSYRKGRALLAGDAAHACSPFGGKIPVESLLVDSYIKLTISKRHGPHHRHLRRRRTSRLPNRRPSKGL